MPYNLLLLPLLGGFLFLHLTHFFRFEAQRLDGYRLLLYSALYGTLLDVLARIVVVVLGPTPIGSWAGPLWYRFAPFPFAETSALALALGPILALLINLFIHAERSKDIEIRRHGNSLTKLLHRAERDTLPISVTLTSLKWYVGYVTESPNLSPAETYFRILPLVSGYRDRETLETYRKVFYRDVLEDAQVDKNDLVITLPLADVRLASLFDEDVYDEYFADEPSDNSPSEGSTEP
jgi:hypothetical protein